MVESWGRAKTTKTKMLTRLVSMVAAADAVIAGLPLAVQNRQERN